MKHITALIFQTLVVLFLLLPTIDVQAQFNKYELKVMKENITDRFNLLMDTWKEELYFEMYDLGQRQSQKRIARGEFAQRMVDLKWRPSLKPIEIDKIDILYLNYAVIYFWQEFENKINVLRKIRKYMIFPVILEDDIWKFDLTQLIRIPYEGKFDKPIDSKPPSDEKQSPETTAPAQQPAQAPAQQAP